MKKMVCVVMLVVLLIGGFVLYTTSTKETMVPDDKKTVDWYDEELRLGCNEEDGYYLVLKTADDFTPEEREAMHLSDQCRFRITHLDPETVEAIRNGELDV